MKWPSNVVSCTVRWWWMPSLVVAGQATYWHDSPGKHGALVDGCTLCAGIKRGHLSHRPTRVSDALGASYQDRTNESVVVDTRRCNTSNTSAVVTDDDVKKV